MKAYVFGMFPGGIIGLGIAVAAIIIWRVDSPVIGELLGAGCTLIGMFIAGLLYIRFARLP